MPDIADVCTIVDDRTLRWARHIDAPVERIWRALTTEEEMAVWFMESRLDLRVGGQALFNLPDPFGGTIAKLQPPRLLEIDEGGGMMRFTVSADAVAFTDRLAADARPHGDPSAAGVEQPGGPGTHWSGVAAGWHCFLDALNAHVTGGELPRAEERDALTADYAEWLRARFEGTPAS